MANLARIIDTTRTSRPWFCNCLSRRRERCGPVERRVSPRGVFVFPRGKTRLPLWRFSPGVVLKEFLSKMSFADIC